MTSRPGIVPAGNETVSRRFGVAGLHSVAVGKSFKNLVRVLKLAGPAVGITENQLRKTNDRADRRIGVGRARDDGEITCGRILIWHRKTIGVDEIRVGRTERARFGIHFLGKQFDAACVVPRQAARHVIRAFYKQSTQEIDSLVGVTGLDIQSHRFRQCIDCLHRYVLIQIPFFGNDQSRQQLLRAGRGPLRVRILLVENLPGARVLHEDGGSPRRGNSEVFAAKIVRLIGDGSDRRRRPPGPAGLPDSSAWSRQRRAGRAQSSRVS